MKMRLTGYASTVTTSTIHTLLAVRLAITSAAPVATLVVIAAAVRFATLLAIATAMPVAAMLLVATAMPAAAQEQSDLPEAPQPLPRYGFQQLTVADGLPEGYVRTLTQDRRGYLWIGTQNGFVRYDGREMDVYRPAADSAAPPMQIISTIFEDDNGYIWAGAMFGEAALVRLDPSTGTRTHYLHDPDDPESLSSSNVIAASDAGKDRILVVSVVDSLGVCIDRLDTATGRVKRFRRNGSGSKALCFDSVNFGTGSPIILRDHVNRSWVRTPNGLVMYDVESDSLAQFVGPYGSPYPFEALSALDSMDPLAAELEVGDHEDRTSTFELADDRRVLIVATGELPGALRADYGWIESARGDTVWSMHIDQTAWAGGSVRNRIAVDVASLPAGQYRLRYRSDDTHSIQKWYNTGPVREDLYGIQVLAIDESAPPIPQTETIDKNRSALPSGIVNAVLEDSGGRIWVGTMDGLCRFEPDAGRCTTVFRHDQRNDRSLPRDTVLTLAEDAHGTLWVGTNGGFARLDDPDEGLFTSFEVPDLGSATRSFSAAELKRSRNYIFEIEPDDEALWLRSEIDVIRFEPDLARFTLYEHDPQDPYSLTAQRPNTMLRDRQGTLWVGTGAGLSRFDRAVGLFERVRKSEDELQDANTDGVFGFIETADGSILVGTNAGIERLELSTLSRSRAPAWTLPVDYAAPLLADRAGGVWVQVREVADGSRSLALVRFVPGEGIDLRIPIGGSDSLSLPSQAMAMLQDRQGRIWVGTGSDGVLRLDPEGRRHHQLPFVYGPPRGNLDGALDDRRVISIYEDRAGTIWVGTNLGGLNRFDPETETFTSFYENGRAYSITSIHEDREGRFWIGTYLSGLFLFDRAEERFTAHFDASNELPVNTVLNILEDEEGLLWLTTGRGLVRFDPESRVGRTFGEADGIENIRVGTNAFRTSSGLMLIPRTTDGFTAFDPSLLATMTHPALVTIDRLGVRDARGSERFLSLMGTPPSSFAADENDLTFEFNVIEFASPNSVAFRYRLAGYEEDWTHGDAQRVARFTNLSPGEYSFEVMAANADGMWSAPQTLSFAILPPWWRTWWAYIFYGLILVGGGIGVDRVQRRRLVRQERERARERELEQARELSQAHKALEASYRDLKAAQAQLIQQEKMASLGQLTAGIAHEIKNPLNFVNNFSDLSVELIGEVREELDAIDGDTGPIREILADIEMNVTKIAEHGRRADGIVRSMLDHSRGSTGARESIAVTGLVDEYVNLAYHGMRAQRADFNATIERAYDPDTGSVLMVPQDVGRVILNLANNAFQAVHEKAAGNDGYDPVVRIATRRGTDHIEISVEDNGPGIPEEIREKIFEPFFTTKPTGQGTGLGLSLSYDIIAQGHGGTMNVENKPDGGARFIITLPDQDTPAGRRGTGG